MSLAAARGHFYLDRTEADIAAGRYDSARSNLAQADVEMIGLSREERKQHLLTARAFWLQSLIYYYKGSTNEAREEMLLALQNLEGSCGGEILLANVLNQLGNVEYYHEHYHEAADYYQRSSEVAIAVGVHTIAAKAMANLGIINAANGHLDHALISYANALEQAELSGDPLRKAETYRLVAGFYVDAGPGSRALHYIEKAVALRDQIEDQSALARILLDGGEVYLKYRDLDKAEDYLRDAISHAQRSDYKLVLIPSLVAMAELMRLKGQAEEWLNYATRAFSQIGSSVINKATAALQLVRYYASVGEWVTARRYIQSIEDICSTNPEGEEQIDLNHAKAILHTALGEWDEAGGYFQQAITLAEDRHHKLSLVTLQEAYATMLLRRAATAHDPAVYQQATTLLKRVAEDYRIMELPHHIAIVEALLTANPPM